MTTNNNNCVGFIWYIGYLYVGQEVIRLLLCRVRSSTLEVELKILSLVWVSVSFSKLIECFLDIISDRDLFSEFFRRTQIIVYLLFLIGWVPQKVFWKLGFVLAFRKLHEKFNSLSNFFLEILYFCCKFYWQKQFFEVFLSILFNFIIIILFWVAFCAKLSFASVLLYSISLYLNVHT